MSLFHAGFVGVIGLPNAGKSTLVNLVVGQKVSIVTSKPQTTRRRSIGFCNTEALQAILVDSPGVIRAESGLNKFLQEETEDIIKQSDALMVLLHIDERSQDHLQKLIDLVAQAKKPWVAVIHKVDLPLQHRASMLKQMLEPHNIPVITGSSLTAPEHLKAQVLSALYDVLPEAPGPLYDSELYTLQNTRELCSEMIREQCFLQLHEEIPFGLAVRIQQFIESQGPLVRIHADVLVAKENHRGIVVGRSGSKLKSIGTAARQEIEKFLGRKIYLDLHVSCAKNWSKNHMVMKELGYVINT